MATPPQNRGPESLAAKKMEALEVSLSNEDGEDSYKRGNEGRRENRNQSISHSQTFPQITNFSLCHASKHGQNEVPRRPRRHRRPRLRRRGL